MYVSMCIFIYKYISIYLYVYKYMHMFIYLPRSADRREPHSPAVLRGPENRNIYGLELSFIYL